MEILVLIMLYYLTQNADFEKTVKPLMGSLKNSENVLKFMNDLAKFSELFSTLKPPKEEGKKTEKQPNPSEKEKKPCSKQEEPTDPIANEFIRECLEKYFQKR